MHPDALIKLAAISFELRPAMNEYGWDNDDLKLVSKVDQIGIKLRMWSEENGQKVKK
jgi:hypothetical protein